MSILQSLSHHILNSIVNLILVKEIVEEESNDTLTSFYIDSENDELITSQKSTQNKNQSKTANNVI